MPDLWQKKKAEHFYVLKCLGDEAFMFATLGHYISSLVREVNLETKKGTF